MENAREESWSETSAEAKVDAMEFIRGDLETFQILMDITFKESEVDESELNNIENLLSPKYGVVAAIYEGQVIAFCSKVALCDLVK